MCWRSYGYPVSTRRSTRLVQPSLSIWGNGAAHANFAPIELKPRIWTFQMG